MLSQPTRSSHPHIRVPASPDIPRLPPNPPQLAFSASKLLSQQPARIRWKHWHSWFHTLPTLGIRRDLVDVRAITRCSLEPLPFPDAAAQKSARDRSYGIEKTTTSQNAAGSITLSGVNSNQHVISKDSTSIPGIIYPPATTVGKSTNIVWQACMVKKPERQKLIGQKGCVIWITGLSGSGKSTLACALDHALLTRGKLSYILDGDNLRHGLNNNLGFSAEDRTENIRRVGEVAKLFVDAGIICIASLISPYRKDRDACRRLVDEGEFIEVYMNFPLQLCEKRDPKGLYKLARAGKIKGFTGIDDPYEPPLNCEIVMEPIEGRCPTPAEMAEKLITYLEERCVFAPP